MNDKEAASNGLKLSRVYTKQTPLIYDEIPFKDGKDKLVWICFRIRWTHKQIASAFGVSMRTVRRWARKYKR